MVGPGGQGQYSHADGGVGLGIGACSAGPGGAGGGYVQCIIDVSKYDHISLNPGTTYVRNYGNDSGAYYPRSSYILLYKGDKSDSIYTLGGVEDYHVEVRNFSDGAGWTSGYNNYNYAHVNLATNNTGIVDGYTIIQTIASKDGGESSRYTSTNAAGYYTHATEGGSFDSLSISGFSVFNNKTDFIPKGGPKSDAPSAGWGAVSCAGGGGGASALGGAVGTSTECYGGGAQGKGCNMYSDDDNSVPGSPGAIIVHVQK